MKTFLRVLTTLSAPSGFNSFFQNEAGSGFTADGTSYLYQLDSYAVISGVTYVSGSPISANPTDNNDGNPFSWDFTWGDNGNDSGFIVRRSTDGGSTWTYHDIGLSGCPGSCFYSDSNFSDDGSGVNWGRTFPGSGPITRNYSAYGYLDSPGTYYSTTHFDYTATDSNPPQGYVWKHNLTYGSTPNAKLLGSTSGAGLTNGFVLSSTDFIDFNGVWSGDNIVTPSHVGHVGDGSTVTFHEYSHVNSPDHYSQAFASASYLYPNDGVYRYLTLGWTNASGSDDVKFLRDTGSGFTTAQGSLSGTALTYLATSPAWDSSLVLMPNSIPGTAGIFENAAQTKADKAQLVIKSNATGVGTTNAERLEFQDASSIPTLNLGWDPAASKAYLNFPTTFSFRNSGTEFNSFAPTVTTFNAQNSFGNTFWIKGGSTLTNWLYGNSGNGTWYMGYNNALSGNGATLSVNQKDATFHGLYINGAGASTTNFPLDVHSGASGTDVFKVNDSGHIILGSTSSNSAWLNLSAGTTTTAPFNLLSGSLTSAQTNGNFGEYDGTHFYATDTSSTRKIMLLTGTASAITSGNIPKANASGNLVDSPVADTGSLITLNEAVEFKQDFSSDSGKNGRIGGTLSVNAGTSGGVFAVAGGVLFDHFTDAGNTTTTETTLYTDNLPANGLSTNGYGFSAEYAGTVVGSSSTKQIRVYLDGTVIMDTGAYAASANGHWNVKVLCMRDSATSARCTATAVLDQSTGLGAQASEVNYQLVTVANWTSIRILKITGQAAGGSAATNDIVAKLGKVSWLP